MRPVRVGADNQTQVENLTQGGSQAVKLEEGGWHKTKQEAKTRQRETLNINMKHFNPWQYDNTEHGKTRHSLNKT